MRDMSNEWWKKPEDVKDLNEWWKDSAEEDIRFAIGLPVSSPEKNIPELYSLTAIAKALVEIRDELRRWNNGKVE